MEKILVKIILYKYESNKKSDGSYPVMLRVTKDRKRSHISLGVYATPNQWIDEAGLYKRDKRLNPEWENENEWLNDKLKEAKNIIRDIEKEKKEFTFMQFRERFLNTKETELLCAYWSKTIIHFEKTRKLGQKKTHDNSLEAFKIFDSKFKKREFQDITYDYINKFYEYYKYKRNTKDTTISIYLRSLRSILNKAIEDGVGSAASYPFSNKYAYNSNHKVFKINQKLNHQTQPRHLPIEILRQINNAKFEKYWLMWTQKLFMFSFHAYGLNFIDMGYLKNKDLDLINKKITYIRKKTKKLYTVILNDDLVSLLDEFKKNFLLIEDYILPIVSTEKIKDDKLYIHINNKRKKFNSYLKNIADELEIPHKLSSYYSRHSYAMALKEKGVSTSVISEALGHENESVTQTYLDKFQNDQVAEASKNLLD